VKRAPTRWGAVDLHFERHGDEATWRWSPVQAWTALTLPPGAVVGAAPGGALRAGVGDVRVLAPPGTGAARVRLRSTGGG